MDFAALKRSGRVDCRLNDLIGAIYFYYLSFDAPLSKCCVAIDLRYRCRIVDLLNFPLYEFKTRVIEGKPAIFDEIRKKWVPLLPEEWVRQHTIHFLIREKGFPAGLLSIEKGFEYQSRPQRADIVAYNRRGEALLMVECKAPYVKIEQDVFDQAARYNRVIRAAYLFVTNGLQHYCCKIDWAAQRYQFVEDIPAYDAL